jgi:chemotaxis signal transduction protein
MANYKGIELHDSLHGLVRHMDDVESTREALQSLQGVWDTLAMLGQLTGIGVEIGSVRADFGALTGRLLNQLGQEALSKAALSLRSKAQVAVDVLVRNLFERTADIGFLATDDDLRAFMQADQAERVQTSTALTQRLRDYQRKYTVYKDIVLLTTDSKVLARLDTSINVAASSDPWTADIMASEAPYMERHAAWDLRPGEAASLVYACRVTSADGKQVLGALCLVFDLEDELRRIFEGLNHLDGQSEDWSVVTLIDGKGRVVASSDVQQVPLGAPLEALTHGSAQAVRFAGRRWLASTCQSSPYQGYAGPGWRGHVMLPLEQAFNAHVAARGRATSTSSHIDEAVMRQLSHSPRLFSEALRDIPRSAAHIEASLTRAVWNGNLALGHGLQAGDCASGSDATSVPSTRDVSFAKTLLREIGHTGTRTRDVFTRAIAELNQTVVSSVLAESEVSASLAVDLMDRNLYERANDCRWWALNARFRSALASASNDGSALASASNHGIALHSSQIDAATQRELTHTLKTIHGLYTVYTNLILFDCSGRVVAASVEDAHCAVGQTLHFEWVQRSLNLRDPQGHVVSAFEPTALYGQRATYVYVAPVRAPGSDLATVGGIAIVFDAAPQFEAMLTDTLPRDAAGQVKAASFGVFVDGDGHIIASTRADLKPGVRLALDLSALKQDAHDVHSSAVQPSNAAIVSFDNKLYAVGACRAVGYREYRGAEVMALSMNELADDAPVQARSQATSRPAARNSALATAGNPANREPAIDLATFTLAGQWYGLPGSDVMEAMGPQQVLPLPLRDKGRQALIRGSVMLRGEPVAVLDVSALMQGKTQTAAAPASSDAQQIIIVKTDDRRRFAMLVDGLGDTPVVAKSRLNKAEGMGGDPNRLVEYLVRPAAGSPVDEDILMLLSSKRLANLVLGAG